MSNVEDWRDELKPEHVRLMNESIVREAIRRHTHLQLTVTQKIALALTPLFTLAVLIKGLFG